MTINNLIYTKEEENKIIKLEQELAELYSRDDPNNINNISFIFNKCSCGDSSCDEYWYDCFVNEEKLDYRYGEPSDAISDILSYFGINNSVDFIYGNEEYN